MSKQLEAFLRQSGLITEAQLARDVEQARKQNVSLIDVILKEERVTEDQLADLLAARTKIPRIRVAASVADPEAMQKVPDKLARKHNCLPLSIDGRVLTLAMADPGDYLAIQDVEFASAMSVRPVIATRSEILDGIDERYAAEDRIGSFLANVPDVTDLHIVADDSAQDLIVAVADSRSEAEVAPVVKMCNLIVHDAIKAGASDTHIEPTMHDVNVRMRVDGVLRDYTHVPKWLHSPLVSRLKILAKLDIAERRVPQDGRINVQYQGRSIDIRVSTLPTHFGEKAVLRYLGGGTLPKVDRMGLNETQSAILESVIKQPQGMILVTGPTGSGKTTTLYALLAKRKSPEVNIVTVEDPIEYQLAGINQVQINPKAGLSFAGVLRSILRQDPDVILVGETRDQETAEVAFQAAMTGHLVLSTLHTNSAVAAIPRLYDLDVDPSILATSLTLVIAQRLVRRICEQCKEAYLPDPATALKVGLSATDGPVYRGKGCPSCGGTGFSGRVGIYEFFRPTNAVRKLISTKASESDLKAAARQSGMKLLREDALDKVKQGITSPDEVLRVVQVDETETPCPQCGALIEADFATCPYCLGTLKKTCPSCGQDLKVEWKACPYCNSTAVSHAGGEGDGAAAPVAKRVSAEPEVSRRAAPTPPAPPPTPPSVRAARTGPKLATPSAMSFPGVRTFDFDDIQPPGEIIEVSQGVGIDLPAGAPDVSAPSVPTIEVEPIAMAPKPGPPRATRSKTAPPVPVPPATVVVPSPAPAPPVVVPRSVPAPSPVLPAPAPASPPPAKPPQMPKPGPAEVEFRIPPASVPPAPTEAEASAPLQKPRTTKAKAAGTVPPPAPVPPPVVPPPADESTLFEATVWVPPVVPSPAAESTLFEATVWVPPVVVARPPTAEPGAAAPASTPDESAGPAQRRLRVMVVDDDDDIRQVVAFTLKKLSVPVDVIQAVDGQEAVELAAVQPPDLFVLDVMMPRLDGFETCTKLRQSVRTAFVPILMLTASADETSRSKGYLVGTDDYMSKPFQPLDLKLRVTRLLRRTYGV